MAKAYGRKVKRSRKIYKKKKTKTRFAAEIAVTLVIASALGVVGYSAGKPLLAFLRGESKPAVEIETTESISTVTESVITASETQPEEASTADEVTDVVQTGDRKIAYTPNNALSNASALSAYLLKLKAEGYNASVIELKDNAGNLWYKSVLASEITGEEKKEHIKGGLTPAQIKAIFDNAEISAVVKINALQDPVAPQLYDDVGYRFAKEDYSWYDASPDKGGKQWANPFLDGTKRYISEIVSELAGAGFSEIILSGMMFPPLTAYDISVLPAEVSNNNSRQNALAALYTACKEKCLSSKLYIEATVLDTAENFEGFKNTAEIFKNKTAFSDNVAVIVMNRGEIGTELRTGTGSGVSLPTETSALVTALYKQAGRNISAYRIIPSINSSEYTNAELEKVLKAFEEIGYDEVVIR